MADTRFTLIVPAAGSGKRLGTETAKPYLALGGMTLLERAVLPFLEIESLSELIVVTSAGYQDRTRAILEAMDTRVDCRCIEGGTERQESIANALEVLDEQIPYVAVHDAARPFVTVSQIRRCLHVAVRTGGAILAVPVRDTVKETADGAYVLQTPERDRFWLAQTPQIFAAERLKRAYRKAMVDGFLGTDDASLVERLSEPVSLVEGGHDNIKITYPKDLAYAEFWLATRVPPDESREE